MKNFGKNFIIAFLMILAIYQTAELWFEDFSSHNFFSFVFDSKSNIVQEDIGYTLDRLIINIGNNKMVCKLNGINNSENKKILDDAIALAINKGNYMGENQVDWKSVLSNRCVIYKYNYSIQGDEIERLFGVKNKSARIDRFDTIIISPNVNGDVMIVNVLNSKDGNMHTYELKRNDTISQSYNVIGKYSADDDSIYYISSVQNGFEIFKGNAFIPRWQGQTVKYNGISILNPIMSDGEIVPAEAEKCANIFFDNPANKWESVMGDSYVYSDENTVVKYNKNGVMEYSGYRAVNDSGRDYGFYDNYAAATSFLQNDSNIKNEFYLTGYSDEENKLTFRFDYRINDFDIILSDDIKSKIGMKSSIEITVDNGKVTKYKRYIYDYYSEEGDREISVDFLDAVNSIYGDIEGENGEADGTTIDDLELAYLIESGHNSEGLKWLISVAGESYIRDTAA